MEGGGATLFNYNPNQPYQLTGISCSISARERREGSAVWNTIVNDMVYNLYKCKMQ